MKKRHGEIAKGYLPISLHSLRLNTVTNFDMYVKYSARERKSQNPFVLYRKRNIPFTERVRRTLTEHGTETLYIDVTDKKEYQVYLENNLDAIIDDKSIPLTDKSNIAYTCATGLVEDLLQNPRSGEHIHRSKPVISNLTNYLLDESQALFSLMAATSFDYYTYTHSVNVSVFGIALAHKLARFSREEINAIGVGLIVHDIGKSLIDQKILNKAGPLNRNEWDMMKKHPEYGIMLLGDSGQLTQEMQIIVSGHHEKLDGTGYPRGLQGKGIHLYARIAALADIFDALTTRRSYKLAERSFPALRIMRDEFTDQIDQDLFKEFVHLLGAEG